MQVIKGTTSISFFSSKMAHVVILRFIKGFITRNHPASEDNVDVSSDL